MQANRQQPHCVTAAEYSIIYLTSPLLMGIKASNLLLFHTKLWSITLNVSTTEAILMETGKLLLTDTLPSSILSVMVLVPQPQQSEQMTNCCSGVSQSQPSLISLPTNEAEHLLTCFRPFFLLCVLSVQMLCQSTVLLFLLGFLEVYILFFSHISVT